MTARDTSAERLLRLRLAARSLIEWKEPPTTERYRQVVADLLRVHPFAAEAGFRPDAHWVSLDTRGNVLWFLSDTLDDAAEPPRRSERDASDIASILRDFRMEQFMKTVDALQNLEAELWEGFTVLDVTMYLYRYLRDGGYPTEHFFNSPVLVQMLYEDEKIQLRWLKYCVKTVLPIDAIRSDPFSLLYGLITRTRLTLSLTQTLIALPFILIGRGGLLSWAAALLLCALLCGNLTTRKIYFFLRQLYIRRALHRQAGPHPLPTEKTHNIGSYAQSLAGRCRADPKLLTALMRDDESGIPVEVVLDFVEGVGESTAQAGIEILADPEISKARRISIFRWLCRVEIGEEYTSPYSPFFFELLPPDLTSP